MAGIAATLVVGAVLYSVIARDSNRLTNWEDNGVGFESLIEAANSGIPAAQFALGSAYRDGNQVEADPSEAFQWFQQAAEQGYARAQTQVAVDYLTEGGGVPVDFEEAIEWLQEAAAAGESDARTHLGWCYANGFGVAQDFERAESLLGGAAREGNLLAMSGIARLLSGEIEGFEPDLEKAYEWHLQAAESGDRAAKYRVGVCLIDGLGVPSDRDEGWSWIEQAAEMGFEPAEEVLRERGEQRAIAEMEARLRQQIERNLQQRPQGANPFSANPYTQRVPSQYREAEQRAYGGFR